MRGLPLMMRKEVVSVVTITVLCLPLCGSAYAESAVDGMFARGQDMPIIPPDVVSRAITPENPTGEPGQGGKAVRPGLGEGRKGSAYIKNIKQGQTVTLMDFEGCGVIRHIWITLSKRQPGIMRNVILRMYWDNSPVPSVEVPLGDFFGTAHGRSVNLSSAYVTTPMGKGFNCWFPMPFAKRAKITLQNDSFDKKPLMQFFYQIDFEQRTSLPPNTGRFHAQFRRQNPTVLKQDYVILDGVEGPGMYVGTVLGVRALSPDWWGEGEMKMYIDGDEKFPTICGTGSEDYFLAAYGMYEFQTQYHGCTLNLTNDFFKNPLVSMYRWHVTDPIYFKKSLKATMQQIGYRPADNLYERSDDWCSTAFWYQMAPITKMPPLPDREARTADIIEPQKPKADKQD